MLVVALIVLHLQPLLAEGYLFRQEHTKYGYAIIRGEPVVLAEEGVIEGTVPSCHICRALILCLLDAFDKFLLRLLPVRTLPLLPRLEPLFIVFFHYVKYIHVRLEWIEYRVIDAEIH